MGSDPFLRLRKEASAVKKTGLTPFIFSVISRASAQLFMGQTNTGSDPFIQADFATNAVK
jgi:hypothetical protein